MRRLLQNIQGRSARRALPCWRGSREGARVREWSGPPRHRAVRRAALILITVLGVAGGLPATAEQGASIPVATAPPEVVRVLQAGLAHAVQRFEAQDIPGVLAHVSERYRTGPFTKARLREQLVTIYGVSDAVVARIRIDEVRMVGEDAWVYSTGEVSGRLRLAGTWVVFLSWQRELEVARHEAGGWRLFGYQQ